MINQYGEDVSQEIDTHSRTCCQRCGMYYSTAIEGGYRGCDGCLRRYPTLTAFCEAIEQARKEVAG